jgi:hypothetical protein
MSWAGADHLEKLPLNADMEKALQLQPEAALAFVRERFGKYAGKFTAGL